MALVVASALAVLPVARFAHAASYSGRATTGAFVSLETSQDPADSVTSNNSAVVSNRISARATGLYSHDLEAAVDLRDKNDMFGRLDAERLRLTPSSTIQAYQAYIRSPGDAGVLHGTLGRFVLPEAGGRFVDGGAIGYGLSRSWDAVAFGGLNPKRDDQTYVAFNRNSQVTGLAASYNPGPAYSLRSMSWSTALVGELTSGNLDRLYWYNNVLYSWSDADRVLASIFLDTHPRAELQTGIVSAHQTLNQRFSIDASLLAVDVIEYTRRQGFFETLASSPYREGALNLRTELGRDLDLDTQGVYGARQADGLTRIEGSAGPSINHLFGGHFQARGRAGYRRNFTGNDVFTNVATAWASERWEADFTMNYVFSRDSGPTLHEWNNEIAAACFFSRDFSAQLSLESAWDEKVTIWTTSARLTYAFGSRGQPEPIDRSPRAGPPLPGGRL